MARQTNLIELNTSNWLQVSQDKANVKVENPSSVPIYVAVAASVNDLNGTTVGHLLEIDEEKSFNNLADSQNVFVRPINSGQAQALVTATDARLASGGAPQTGLTDAQLRADPVIVTVDSSAPLAVDGEFYPEIQDVNLVQSEIIGTRADPVATSDDATASLIALIKKTNTNLTSLSGQIPPDFGKQNAANSSPVTWASEDSDLIGATNEVMPSTDFNQSGLNGRLKRVAFNITALSGKIPANLGAKVASESLAVTQSSEDAARIGATSESAPSTDIAASGLNGRLVRVAQNITTLTGRLPPSLGRQGSPQSLSVALSTGDQALFGEINDTAPTTDTESSGINGRLQRVAQNITTLTAKFPSSLGRSSATNSSPVVLSNEDLAVLGATNEAAPASDTAASGLNGRLQRLAQNQTVMSAKLPATLGQKAGSASLSVVLASDQPALTITSSNSGVVNTANSTTSNLLAGGVFTGPSVDISAYGSVSVSVFTSHASGTDGLSIQQSTDGTNWDFTDAYTVASGQTKINVPRQAQYFRVVYTNGATATTAFRLQTILNNQMPRGSSVRPGDAMTLQNDYDQTISVPSVYNGTSFDLARGATNGLNSVGTGITASQLVAQFDDVSIVATTENSFGNVRMSQDHVLYTASSPTASAGTAIVPVTTTVVASALTLKASAGNLYGVNIVTGASAGYLMLFNTTAAPADGAVTPLKVLPIAANSGAYLTFEVPLRFSVGITAVFSTTGPFTKTASATAFISGDVM